MLKCCLAVLVIVSGFCTPRATREPQKVNAPAEQKETDTTAERYAVYSALLKQKLAARPVKLLVIESSTEDDPNDEPDKRWDNLKTVLAPNLQSVVDDYKVRNLRPSALENKFTVPTQVILVSKEEVDRLFGEGGGWWEAFYKRYPNSSGLIQFSNVGFNPEMSYALVYIAHSCGGLCGTGGLVLMVKKDGNWTVEQTLSVWVS